MMYQVVLVRYGEIALKGRNRRFFEEALLKNIRQNLRGLAPRKVSRVEGRVLVPLMEDWEEVRGRLATVCGIVSFSPARVVPRVMEDIGQAALEELAAVIKPGDTFKMEARRADKTFPVTSPEMNRDLGSLVLKNIQGIKVDIHRPQHRLVVEVRREGAYVFSQVHAGTSGLPVGVSGRGILMLSGGIDSPVAGYMAARRGIDLVALHFYSYPFTGERSKEKVISLCRILACYNGETPLYIAHFTEIQKAIVSFCPEPLRITIMRRMMLRVAERVAEAEGALAIFTGESLGQVASQTLESMAVIGAVTGKTILRPLIGLDKAEIVDYARRLGTYSLSILPFEDCCTLFVPEHPATRPGREQTEAAEAGLEVETLVAECLQRTELLRVPPFFEGQGWEQ